MAEKVTVMVLKVDLQCSRCYKKIKNILCKCPKIRGQIFDVKQNTVTINVVCCSPEKVRDKLICKAGKVIKCIEIKKPKEQKKLPPPPPTPPSSPPPPPPPDTPPPPPPPRTCCELCSEGHGGGPCYRGEPPVKEPPTRTCCGPCSEGYGGGPCYHVGLLYLPPVHPKIRDQPPPPPTRTCCGPCSEGYSGGPCYQGYPAPPPCYDGYYGYGSGCRCGFGRGYQLKCVCFVEENPSPECKIM